MKIVLAAWLLGPILLCASPSGTRAVSPQVPPSSAAPTAPGEGVGRDGRVERVRARCAEFVESGAVVGMAVAVLDGGKPLFEGAFGFRDREAELRAETGTLFRLASISKPVTATIAMQLVEAKRLELDVPVSKYVDGLEPALGAVSLRQILSHTSGIRHYQLGRFDNGILHRTTEQALALFAKDPLIAPPGTKYSYSTHAFTLAVAAIEKAAHEDFGALVRARIGSRVPALDLEIASEKKAARSALYDKRDGKLVRSEPREDLSWKYGGGGMESTAADLARFAELVRKAELVGPTSRDLMWTRARTTDGAAVDYGLGWVVGERGELVSHTGGQQGASASLSILRERGLIVVVLTNTTGGDAPELGKAVRELLARN